MVAGDKRRKIDKVKPLTLEDLEKKCKLMSSRDACLVALLYLSGRRINEILHLKKEDIIREKNRISFETFNLKDYRQTQRGDYTIKRYVEQRNFKGRKSKIYSGFLFYRLIKPHFRLDSESGKRLGSFILFRLGVLPQKYYLFKSQRGKSHIGYSRAYQIFRKHFPELWPHVLRHERFTEIFKVYSDDLLEAHRLTYHKRMESDLPYIRKLQVEKERI